MLERVKSGIPGLDKAIGGGFIKNSINLLSGGTGTGKTIFCLQFLYNGAKDMKEKGVYISFEETEDELRTDAAEIGLDFKDVGEKVKFVYIPPYSLTDFTSVLRSKVITFGPQRVVIDSLSALTMPLEDDFERKKEIFRINELLKELECTTILTSEIPSEAAGQETSSMFSRFGIEEFLCDSVIVLHYAGLGGEDDRAVRVVKMRRSNHTKNILPMKIAQGGVKVGSGK